MHIYVCVFSLSVSLSLSLCLYVCVQRAAPEVTAKAPVVLKRRSGTTNLPPSGRADSFTPPSNSVPDKKEPSPDPSKIKDSEPTPSVSVQPVPPKEVMEEDSTDGKKDIPVVVGKGRRRPEPVVAAVSFMWK